MAAGDLTTVSNVKAFLKLTTSADDALLQSLITGLSGWAEKRLERTIAVTVYTDRFSGRNQRQYFFSRGPVTDVLAVVVDGVTWVAERDYWFDAMSLQLIGRAFPRGSGNVRVQFQAGYATVPAGLQQIMTELVALVYRERDRIGASSKTVGPETIAYITAPANQRTLEGLDEYIWVAPS